MVLRDEEGQVIFAACRNLMDCMDAMEAETLACHEGLQMALEWSDKPILVELDCSCLVDAIRKKAQDRSPQSYYISEIKALINCRRVISFVKADHTQNRASHGLANFARAEERSATWQGSAPEFLVQVLDHDRHVTPIE